jgi:hypothetical protein
MYYTIISVYLHGIKAKILTYIKIQKTLIPEEIERITIANKSDELSKST